MTEQQLAHRMAPDQHPIEHKTCISCGQPAAYDGADWVHQDERHRSHPASVVELGHEERMSLADWLVAYDANEVGATVLETLVEEIVSERLLARRSLALASLSDALTICHTRATQHGSNEAPGLERAMQIVEDIRF